MKELTRKVKLKYENFKPYLPIIYDLRNPSMEKANWSNLNKLIKEYNETIGDNTKKINV